MPTNKNAFFIIWFSLITIYNHKMAIFFFITLNDFWTDQKSLLNLPLWKSLSFPSLSVVVIIIVYVVSRGRKTQRFPPIKSFPVSFSIHSPYRKLRGH